VVLCSVAEVRAKVYTSTLTDADITNIITEVSEEILSRAGSTDESNSNLILAGKNASAAAVLRRMRTTGEMAANVRQGNSQQQNSIDQDIKDYEAKAELFLQKYMHRPSEGFVIVSGRVGPEGVNIERS
jgi:ribosomal protein L12E/L44/L45/RPP1/RPP2